MAASYIPQSTVTIESLIDLAKQEMVEIKNPANEKQQGAIAFDPIEKSLVIHVANANPDGTAYLTVSHENREKLTGLLLRECPPKIYAFDLGGYIVRVMAFDPQEAIKKVEGFMSSQGFIAENVGWKNNWKLTTINSYGVL